MNETFKNSLIAALVAVAVALCVVLPLSHRDVSSPSTGLSQSDIGEFPEGVQAGDVTSRWYAQTLAPQANSVILYRNTSGRDTIIDLASVEIKTGETASSSSKVSVFATSTAMIPTSMNFGTLAEGKRALIQAVNIATSTTATTTSSTYAEAKSVGNGVILVPDGFYVYGYLQQNISTTLGCVAPGATPGACESATSTNRGFNPLFKVRVQQIQ